jgi:prepilin-type N-terminal cleavage/methylation domain-containing protein
VEKQRLKRKLKHLHKQTTRPLEGGFTLIEVLIGLLLLAVVGLVFASALQQTGRDYQTASLLNRASRVATSEVEACKAMAARGDFASITNDVYKHGEYDITWQVVDKTVTSDGQVKNTPTGGTANLKEVTITVTHETRKDISVVRTVRVGPR